MKDGVQKYEAGWKWGTTQGTWSRCVRCKNAAVFPSICFAKSLKVSFRTEYGFGQNKNKKFK